MRYSFTSVATISEATTTACVCESLTPTQTPTDMKAIAIIIMLLLGAFSAFGQFDSGMGNRPNGGRKRPAEFKREYKSENYSCDPSKVVRKPSVAKKKAQRIKAKRAKVRAKLASKRAKAKAKKEKTQAKTAHRASH